MFPWDDSDEELEFRLSWPSGDCIGVLSSLNFVDAEAELALMLLTEELRLRELSCRQSNISSVMG